MRRSSSSGVRFFGGAATAFGLTESRTRIPNPDSRIPTGFTLATVFPRDDQSERDVQAAEPYGHKEMSQVVRRDERSDPEQHEAEAHQWNDFDRQCAAGRDGR